MSFEQLTLEAALTITKNLRPVDRECLNDTMDMSDEGFALNRWQTNGAAWHLLQDGKPVCMGGISQPVPWCGVAWMVSTDGISLQSRKKLIRFSRTVFTNAQKSLQRIEAHVLGGWMQAETYAKTLGFQLEGVRHNATRSGKDVLIFAIA